MSDLICKVNVYGCRGLMYVVTSIVWDVEG